LEYLKDGFERKNSQQQTNLVLISVDVNNVELKVDVNKVDELDINKVEGATVDTPEQSVPL
jgi:hypothetical protein